MRDSVDGALAAVPFDYYARQPSGEQLPQSSAPEIIVAVLRLLEVQPGMRVLEVGTGSGYSTMLLAHLVGPTGQVVSLDVDAALTARAADLLERAGCGQVTVVAADGRAGYPAAAPYDGLVAWATADRVPMPWVEQLREGGRLVAPVRLVPLAGLGVAVIRARVDPPAALVGERVIPGAFVPLTDVALHQWTGPASDADVVVEVAGSGSAWASAAWLRDGATSQGTTLLGALMARPGPRHPGEDAEALWAYLLATQPTGLTTAWTPDTGTAFGCSRPGSMALLSVRTAHYVEAGERVAAETLRRWVAQWRAVGRAGFAQVQLRTARQAHGWRVQATMPTRQSQR
jgi:protein-L-isoaspartate(D-aspartate) O-methyltransferase